MIDLRRKGALALAALTLLTAGACAGQSASPTPIALTNGPVIATLVKKTPDNTATPVPPTNTPAPPASRQSAIPPPTSATEVPLEQPTIAITSSGPTLASLETNAKKFNQASPKQIGPFRRVDSLTESNQYGSILKYQTDEGAQYEVLLFISLSAQDAFDRYRAETATFPSKQAVKLGDEGVITPAGNYVLAEVRYRNMVLVIHRPNPNEGTVPIRVVTDDQVIALVTALFKAIPPS